MAIKKVTNKITIENARILFRNLKGEKTQYNPAGSRSFCVLIDDDLAEKLAQDGWNVKYLEPKEDRENIQAYLQVFVKYDNYPPKIVLITGNKQTLLDIESVDLIDWAEIESVDLQITPYNWVLQEGTKNEKRGIKAYVKSMYVQIVEDPLEKKWSNAPIEQSDVEFE